MYCLIFSAVSGAVSLTLTRSPSIRKVGGKRGTKCKSEAFCSTLIFNNRSSSLSISISLLRNSLPYNLHIAFNYNIICHYQKILHRPKNGLFRMTSKSIIVYLLDKGKAV